MVDIITLNIDTPMIDPNTLKPVRVISTAKAIELGLKNQYEIEQNLDKFPESVLGNVITSIFNNIQMTSNTLHLVYSRIFNDILTARQKGESTIDISKDTLEKFKTIFSEKPPGDPKNNRNVSFILGCIEIALAKSITETIPDQTLS